MSQLSNEYEVVISLYNLNQRDVHTWKNFPLLNRTRKQISESRYSYLLVRSGVCT